MKKCPYCAEKIQDEAIVCMHCGSNLEKESTGRVTLVVNCITKKYVTFSGRASRKEFFSYVGFVFLFLFAYFLSFFIKNTQNKNLKNLTVWTSSKN